MAENEDMLFDEEQAIKFIRDYMPENIRERYDDDEILNIVDMIWDYYEDNGMLEIPSFNEQPVNSNNDSPQLEPIMDYVKKMLAKDKLAVVDTNDVQYIIKGELAYEKSIGLE
ncbi:MAG: hypothetical protein NC343_02495 [Muribaculum sp.]|nr:hypothetical protein [Muribaculaceae bacterium]MCM1080595.1 hypothetical protein [Muribaculum sp.]